MRTPNMNALPSGTGVNIIIIITAAVQLSLWLGSFLPNGIDFVSLTSVRQPGLYNTDSAVGGILFCAVTGIVFGLSFIWRRKLAFGNCSKIAKNSHAYDRIMRLNERSAKPVKRVFVGGTIFDTDALAFGFGPWRSILIGRGFETMATVSPDDFDIRFLHELAHFENRDTINGLIGLSLLVSAVSLFGFVAIWQLARPLIRVYSHSDPGAWVSYNIYKALGSLSILVPGGIFWLIVLILEFLSFLRRREVLADAQVMLNGQKKNLLAALDTEGDEKSFLPGLLHSHPTTKQRFEWCINPISMYKTNVWRFFATGFLFSVSLNQTMTTLQMGLGASGNPKCGTMVECSRLLVTNTAFFISSQLSFALLSTAVGFLSLSLLLSQLISKRNIFKILSSIGLATIAVSAGYISGEIFHPFDFIEQQATASKILRGLYAFPNFLHMPQIGMVHRVIFFAVAYLLTTMIILIAASIIVKGARTKPIGGFGWLSLIVLPGLITNSILTMFASVAQPETQIAPQGFYTGMVGVFFIYIILFLVLVWRLTGGMSDQQDETPKWLYAKSKITYQ